MATSSLRSSSWWTALMALLVLVCCAVGADDTYYRRDISGLIGNSTIRLQLITDPEQGYLNAISVLNAYKRPIKRRYKRPQRYKRPRSFKLLNANPELPNVYLRFDGKGVVDGKPGGVVYGQTYVSDFERLLVENY